MAGATDHFHHVRDFPYFELWGGMKLPLPKFDIPGLGEFQLTKLMVLQVAAGLLTLLVFKGLAAHVGQGRPTRGRFWNFWEALALFIRDEVVRPTIGDEHHDHGHDDHGHGHDHDHSHGHGGHSHAHTEPALSGHHSDRFLPYIWTCFFFILFCNLLGAIPLLGSPTGSICLTGVLAVSTLVYNVTQGSKSQGGFITFMKNQCPNLGLSGGLKVGITAILWPIECVGLLIKHGVLAVRLFANIMGGHTVVGVMLGFIAMEGVPGTWLQMLVIPGSILGQVFIGMLELFVAFLQAYVFAYLATIFLSSSLHAH